MGRTFLSTLSPTILNRFHTGFGEDAGRDSGCFSSMGLISLALPTLSRSLTRERGLGTPA